MSEIAVHEIGPDFALQHLVAPVTDVFQQKESQDHIGRRAFASTSAALRVAARQGIVNRRVNCSSSSTPVGVFSSSLLGRSATSSAMKPSPKRSCCRRASITRTSLLRGRRPGFLFLLPLLSQLFSFKAAGNTQSSKRPAQAAVPGRRFVACFRRNV